MGDACAGVNLPVASMNSASSLLMTSESESNLNSLLVKRQIGNPSPGAVTGGN